MSSFDLPTSEVCREWKWWCESSEGVNGWRVRGLVLVVRAVEGRRGNGRAGWMGVVRRGEDRGTVS